MTSNLADHLLVNIVKRVFFQRFVSVDIDKWIVPIGWDYMPSSRAFGEDMRRLGRVVSGLGVSTKDGSKHGRRLLNKWD